jgi:hypothetical protein
VCARWVAALRFAFLPSPLHCAPTITIRTLLDLKKFSALPNLQFTKFQKLQKYKPLAFANVTRASKIIK